MLRRLGQGGVYNGSQDVQGRDGGLCPDARRRQDLQGQSFGQLVLRFEERHFGHRGRQGQSVRQLNTEVFGSNGSGGDGHFVCHSRRSITLDIFNGTFQSGDFQEYSAPRLNGPRLNGHPVKLATFVNYQMINLHHICPDNRPTRFNGQKMAGQTLAV